MFCQYKKNLFVSELFSNYHDGVVTFYFSGFWEQIAKLQHYGKNLVLKLIYIRKPIL